MNYFDLIRKEQADDHRYLVHGDGSKCEDGCDRPADPKRLAEYIDSAERDAKE